MQKYLHRLKQFEDLLYNNMKQIIVMHRISLFGDYNSTKHTNKITDTCYFMKNLQKFCLPKFDFR